MKRSYRAIANATALVTVVFSILLTLAFTVAPKATAAVISYLFQFQLESPFWTEGGVVFLGGAILWVGGILLASGGGTLLFECLVQGLAQRPGVNISFNESSVNVERNEDLKLWLGARPTAAGSPAGQIVTPQHDDGGSEAPLNL